MAGATDAAPAGGFGLFQFHVNPSLWGCLAAALVVGAVAGALVANFISHRRGIYYALLTVAFGEAFVFKPEGIAGMLQALAARARRVGAPRLAPSGGPASTDDGPPLGGEPPP